MSDIVALARQKLNDAYLRFKRGERVEGYIGKQNAALGTWEVNVPTRTNYVYVTLKTNSPTAPVEALCTEVTPKAGTPVYVERDIDTGEFVVKANAKQMAAFSGGVNLGVGRHTHRLGFGNEDVVEGLRFEPLLCHIVEGGSSLYVKVEAGFYRYNDADVFFGGGTLNLTANVPGTANMWAWVKVGIDPTTNTLVAKTGTLYAKVVPLTGTELAPIAFDSNDTLVVRIAGVKLRNGQTAIADWRDFYDLRPFASGQNAPAGTSGDDAYFLRWAGF